MIGTKKRDGQDAPGWGGKRQGSGRKPELGEAAAKKTAVTLRPADVELYRALGDGNVSRGLRVAADLIRQTRRG